MCRVWVRTETKGRTWYGLAGWRWGCWQAPWLQTTISYSDHVFDRTVGYTNGANYLRDLAFTVRVDLTNNWYAKIEAHDMHGWGWVSFIPPAQTGHKSEHWFLLALKTGVAF